MLRITDSINILKGTPTVLTRLIEELPERITTYNEGPDTWSAYDIIGHLIHGEKTDWIPRIQQILDPNRRHVAFEPFDRFAQFENSKGKTLKDLLEEFSRVRFANLETFVQLNLTTVELDLRGIHPEIGEVTLGQLIATWVVHDLSHINQMTRILGKYYADDVGPWKKYISMLK